MKFLFLINPTISGYLSNWKLEHQISESDQVIRVFYPKSIKNLDGNITLLQQLYPDICIDLTYMGLASSKYITELERSIDIFKPDKVLLPYIPLDSISQFEEFCKQLTNQINNRLKSRYKDKAKSVEISNIDFSKNLLQILKEYELSSEGDIRTLIENTMSCISEEYIEDNLLLYNKYGSLYELTDKPYLIRGCRNCLLCYSRFRILSRLNYYIPFKEKRIPEMFNVDVDKISVKKFRELHNFIMLNKDYNYFLKNYI